MTPASLGSHLKAMLVGSLFAELRIQGGCEINHGRPSMVSSRHPILSDDFVAFSHLDLVIGI